MMETMLDMQALRQQLVWSSVANSGCSSAQRPALSCAASYTALSCYAALEQRNSSQKELRTIGYTDKAMLLSLPTAVGKDHQRLIVLRCIEINA